MFRQAQDNQRLQGPKKTFYKTRCPIQKDPTGCYIGIRFEKGRPHGKTPVRRLSPLREPR